MPSITSSAEIISRRKRRQLPPARSQARLRRLALIAAVLFSLALVGAGGYFAFLYADVAADLPALESLPVLLGPQGQLRQPTRLYDRTGETELVALINPNAVQAEYLFLELIPDVVVDAVLASQDPQYWEQDGYNLVASETTIPEKLVQDLLLWQEPDSVQHIWRVRLLAAQMVHTYGRETVLEWYLNSADFGQLAYGIDAAARVYFGKPAADLNLAEAATLGAVAAAPALNPIEAPQIASERQNSVLSKMLALGYITETQALNANAVAIPIQSGVLPLTMRAPQFTQLALEKLYALVGQDRLQRGGFEIVTTLDLSLQTQANCTVEIQLARLNGDLPIDSLGNLNCAGGTQLPTLNREDVIAGASPQAGAVVIDPETGQVLALVGEVDAPQQAGTILSPFIYLTAFTRGMSPASLIWDIPASVPPNLEGYGNQDGTFHGPMRIRTASAHDYLVPVLSVLRLTGPANAWRTAQQSGIFSLEIPQAEDSYAPLFEDGRYSLLEITHAYSMFANAGTLVGVDVEHTGDLQPIFLLEVKDLDGRIWPGLDAQIKPVTTPQLAYLVTDMLADEDARRESMGYPNAFEIGRPVAAKLGGGLTEVSTWALGYTPNLIAGVWLGVPEGEDAVQTAQVSPLASAGVWHALVTTASQELPLANWEEPVGMVQQVVCDPSGLLPTEECPQLVNEIFITGSEPLQTDNLYQTFQVNTQTGRLATVYTPTEFIEERVYLVVPPEAQEWAQQQGLETPPDTYDVIFNTSTSSQVTSIQSPEIFSYVSGEVEITGTAAGEDFDFYRLQIGEGLNPRQWLQIGEDSSSPVEADVLGVWDTTGLDGLYAIQLRVVNEDQSVEDASIQVTVDNRPPVIQILQPLDGAVFAYPSERSLTFQAQVTDNLGIARVEFWVDGRMLSSLSDPPYVAPWSGTLGEHEMEVRALDQAGNISVELVTFSLEN